MTKAKVAVFLGLVLLPLTAYGQVTKLASPDDFSAEAIRVDFQDFKDGVPAADLLARWGLRFEGAENSTPRTHLIPSLIGGGQSDVVVENESAGGMSAGEPMIINFKYPVSRVGCIVSNAGTANARMMTAYDPLGEVLGSVVENAPGEQKFVGIATTSNRGIAKLKIEYPMSNNDVQIDDLIFDFVSRPQFETFLPQVGDAAGLLETIIVVTNLSNSAAQGDVTLTQSNGGALSMEMNGTTASVFPFVIPPYSSTTLVSSGASSPVKVGYGVIHSNVPVEGVAIFRIVPGGALLSEVGVGAAPGRYLAVGVAQKVAAENFDTGVAVVNGGDQAADVTAFLVSEGGAVVAVNTTDLDLPAHNHSARFISELFPQFANSNFQGTLVLTSDQPLGIVMVRTLSGLPRSALPVGSMAQ
jgi:hypothetical protein